MIAYDEFRENWQASPLVRSSEEGVETLDIEEASKYFLIEVGLPSRPLFDLFFYYVAQGFPTLSEVCKEAQLFRDYRVIGKWFDPTMPYYDSHAYICFKPNSEGTIVTIDWQTGSDRFFNANVIKMAECFRVHEEYRRTVLGAKTFEEIEQGIKDYHAKVEYAESHLEGEELSSVKGEANLEYNMLFVGGSVSKFRRMVMAKINKVDPEALTRPDTAWGFIIGRY